VNKFSSSSSLSLSRSLSSTDREREQEEEEEEEEESRSNGKTLQNSATQVCHGVAEMRTSQSVQV
jgi:hypothetical protein